MKGATVTLGRLTGLVALSFHVCSSVFLLVSTIFSLFNSSYETPSQTPKHAILEQHLMDFNDRLAGHDPTTSRIFHGVKVSLGRFTGRVAFRRIIFDVNNQAIWYFGIFENDNFWNSALRTTFFASSADSNATPSTKYRFFGIQLCECHHWLRITSRFQRHSIIAN